MQGTNGYRQLSFITDNDRFVEQVSNYNKTIMRYHRKVDSTPLIDETQLLTLL